MDGVNFKEYIIKLLWLASYKVLTDFLHMRLLYLL